MLDASSEIIHIVQERLGVERTGGEGGQQGGSAGGGLAHFKVLIVTYP